MNKLFGFLFLIFCSLFSFSQNVGIGTNTPVASAALEVKDTARGFLPPRMTYAQRNAIVNPVAGLIIWCTDCDSSGQAQVYNGSKWTNLIGGVANIPLITTPTLSIGMNYGGGKIIYIFQPGDQGYVSGETHGYIIPVAAITTTANGVNWGNLASTFVCLGTTIGNTYTLFGGGNLNTSRIISICTSGNNAAYMCDTLTVDGYTDWFLPSKDEVSKVYQNYTRVGGVYPTTSQGVWSSSEINANNGYVCSFDGGGGWVSLPKSYGFYLKPLRKF